MYETEGTGGHVARVGHATSLAGRTRDLEILDRLLTATAETERRRDGAPAGVVVVRGDPGIGKTALLDVVAHRARARGTRILHATGIQSEVDIGFATLTQLFGPLRSLLPQLPSVHRSVLRAVLGDREPSTATTAAQIAEAVNTLLALLAASVPRTESLACPVLTMVDDLQWIDRASADVLGMVARRLNPLHCRMIVAERTATRTHFDTTRHPRLAVEAIDDEAADDLLRAQFPSLSAAARARVLEEASGNPLALLELPKTLDPAHRTVTALPVRLPLTERLKGMFAARITQLPDEARQCLLTFALDEGNRRLDEADWVHQERVLAAAERAALVQVDSRTHRVVFRHPLVRASVVSMSTSQQRREAHRALADSYGTGHERAAWHLAAATVQPDEEVAGLLERAARRAAHRGDAADAVRGLVRAAQLTPTPRQRSRRLAAAAFQGAGVGGDLTQAAALLDRARRADPGSVHTLQAAVATAFVLLNGSGDTHIAHQVIVGALEAAENAGTIDPGVHADAIQTLGEICLYAADPRLWEAFHAAVRSVPLDRFPALDRWVRLMVDPARTARAAVPDLERALKDLSAETDPAKILRTAITAIFVDRVTTVREPLCRLVERARQGDVVGSGALALMLLSLADFHSGDWQRADDRAAEGIGLTETHGLTMLSWPIKFTQALVAAAVGDHDRVQHIVDQMHSWAVPRRAGTVQSYAHRASTLDCLGRGDHAAAYRWARLVCEPGTLPPNRGHALWMSMDLVEAAVHAGDPSAARAHVNVMKQAGLGSLSKRLTLLVAGAEAIASPGTDRELFGRALDLTDASGCPFEVARIRLIYGQRLRRTRAVTEARVHLEAAVDTFTRLGARPWTLRARAELLATSPQKRFAPVSEAPVLTPQERRIATLAAAGRTNKQIAGHLLISPRTVGAHLQHIFTKLDVTSRAGLHRALGAPDDQHPR